MTMSTNFKISIQLFLLLSIVGCNQISNRKKIDGVYHQNQLLYLSGFIYCNNGDFVFSRKIDSFNVFSIHDDLGIIEKGKTIIYRKIYNDSLVMPLFDSILVANRDYCSQGSCFIYDFTIYNTGVAHVRIYYPYPLKGSYQFKIEGPFANWLNRSCNSLDLHQPINFFGNLKDIEEGRKNLALLSCLFYKGNTMNYFFGDMTKMTIEMQLMESVIQQILKIYINNASRDDGIFINPTARDSVGARELYSLDN